jgi:hypothetical protein
MTERCTTSLLPLTEDCSWSLWVTKYAHCNHIHFRSAAVWQKVCLFSPYCFFSDQNQSILEMTNALLTSQ